MAFWQDCNLEGGYGRCGFVAEMGSHTGLKMGGICEQAFLTERLVYIYESAGGDCASYSRCANLNTNYYLCLCR